MNIPFPPVPFGLFSFHTNVPRSKGDLLLRTSQILPSFFFFFFFLRIGLLSWLNGKEPACQCRRCGFNLWVGKIPWSRKWLPTPVFLPGKFHGQRKLVGYIVHGVTKSWVPLRD